MVNERLTRLCRRLVVRQRPDHGSLLSSSSNRQGHSVNIELPLRAFQAQVDIMEQVIRLLVGSLAQPRMRRGVGRTG